MELTTIIAQLNLEEKFALLTGADSWHTVAVERLGIPAISMADGPHGLRKVKIEGADERQTIKAVCFPTSSAMAATWNTKLVRRIGQALGEECGAMEVDILLGPGINIKRTPLCGRNFEYFSEDPLLAGELAAAYIEGVQSQGVGTSLKHFAANNQEFDRFQISSEIDQRTLREIYLKPFEIAVKKAQPWTVMCAYNRLNGIYCSENRFLLHDVLRREWGFEGFVVSDWHAVHQRSLSLQASLELEMPFAPQSAADLRGAYERGDLTITEIDAALERLLTIVFRAAVTRAKRAKEFDVFLHHQLAKEAAAEAIILLKNSAGILPIRREATRRILVIGEFAEKPAIQGGGSARVAPLIVDSPLEALRAMAGSEIIVDYQPVLAADCPKVDRLNEAMTSAQTADLVLLFVGNRPEIEREAYDRTSFALSPEMDVVIERIAAQNPNTVVILQTGAPVAMTAWIDKVQAIVHAGYTGQAGGSALADILFGLTNPSGKTAETFPIAIEDTPAYGSYPGNGYVVRYDEGLMVGYRYYEDRQKKPLFPFGFGLSYTTFEYAGLQVTPESLAEGCPVRVDCIVKNTGPQAGQEIVQLYVRDNASKVTRPVKELKAFTKVSLQPGETQTVHFELNREAFAYFSPSLNDWHIESGQFTILIGASSADIRLEKTITVKGVHDFS